MADYGDEISSHLERADTNLQVAKELLDKGYIIFFIKKKICSNCYFFTPEGFVSQS